MQGHPGALRTAEEQLFFALFYQKSYPTVDVLSFLVGFDRGNACRNAQFLFSAPYPCPRKKLNSQATDHLVEEFFREFPEAKDIFIDGTERRVQNQSVKNGENILYSGKKKATTRKTVVVSDETETNHLILTPVNPADVDKRLFDKAMGGRNILGSRSMDGYRISGAPAGSSKNNHAHEGNQISSPHGRREGRQSSHFRNSCPLETRNCRNQTIPIINHRCLQKQNSFRPDDTFMLLSAGLWNYHLLHDANPLETLQNLSSQLL